MSTIRKLLLLIPALSLVCITNAAPPITTTPQTITTPTQVSVPLPTTTAQAPTIIPNPPDINAKAYVLIDANSGYIIAQKNPNKRMPPASLTKMMTLYISANELQQGQIHLTDKVKVSKEAWRMGGSKMFIKVGTLVPVESLIQGIIVASGNDATYALAQYIGGTEQNFVNTMNQTAQALGMTGTHYNDCNGLPARDHYSTPLDIAKLARAIVLTFPNFYGKWFHQKWINYNHIKQPNRNRLLWRDPSVDGIKTGHTAAAGFCLVSSAVRNGMRLIAVVMGAPTDSARASDSEALLNYGYRFYESHKLYDANTPLATPRVWFGKTNKIALGVAEPLYVTIPAGQFKNVKATMELNKTLKAPITQRQTAGKITVTLGNKVIATQPLIALQADPEAGFFGRFFDHIALFFHNWL